MSKCNHRKIESVQRYVSDCLMIGLLCINSTTAIKLSIKTSGVFTIGPLGPCPLFWNRRNFLANVNSRSRSLYAIARPSVCLSSVCNVRALYSGGSDFRQYFYGIRYLGHPLTSTENFMEIVPGEPLRRGS